MSDNTPAQQKSTKQGRALDERFYDLTDQERAFFKQQTGIQDDDELKTHILQVQAEAYKVHPYPCIRRFHFVKLSISRLFIYQDLLKIGQQRDRSVFLDIGSCFGNDAHKVVADGYPLENVVTSDLHQEFADLGHKLFRTAPESYPMAFVPGDAFDPEHLQVMSPFMAANAPTGPAPDLRSLTSLNPLHGRVSAMHASLLFHLFNEEKQLHLARALAGLLSPEPGSMIFGLHIGLAERGFMTYTPGGSRPRFCHSPESWAQMWDGLVFEKDMVKVWAKLLHVERKDFEGDEVSSHPLPLLLWSVTRL